MSVDTNVKGKNLGAYRKLRHQRYQVYVTPQLIGMAESMRVITKGGLGRRLAVEFQAGPDDSGSCEVC
ncbi:MAG: hypothetical protein AB8G26_02140 [Ilumatobacter sp.]